MLLGFRDCFAFQKFYLVLLKICLMFFFFTVSGAFLFLKKIFYLFIFRKRGRVREREEEKHQCVVASHVTPTGDLAHNPGTCSDWELNR